MHLWSSVRPVKPLAMLSGVPADTTDAGRLLCHASEPATEPPARCWKASPSVSSHQASPYISFPFPPACRQRGPCKGTHGALVMCSEQLH